MAKHRVKHRGVNVTVRRLTAVKNGVTYTSWEVLDYCTGKRVRHQRPTLKTAKAKEVCECLARGKREVLDWDERQRLALRQSLHLLSGTGIEIDRVCGVIADALKLVPLEEILPACLAWRDSRPNKRLVPKKVSEAVREFLARRAARISQRRHKTDRSYLGMFEQKFGGLCLHEITVLQVKDWATDKCWGAKTRNDVLGLLNLFYRDMIERSHAIANPCRWQKRRRAMKLLILLDLSSS